MRKLLILATIVLISPAAHAQNPPANADEKRVEKVAWESLPPLQPFNYTGYYDVSWSGITVGTLVADAHEDDAHYKMSAFIESTGLTYLFTRHKSETTVEGIRQDGRYLPQQYRTEFSTRGSSREIILTYDKTGKMVQEVANPPENRQKRPEVPMELKERVIDLLTTFFVQRGKIYEALARDNPEFTIRMYDGRRLTDLHFKVFGRQVVGWHNQDTPVIHFTFTRTPIAGFKKSELEDIQKEEPDINLYLSDDGQLIPLKIVVASAAGMFYANLARECPSLEACLKLQH